MRNGRLARRDSGFTLVELLVVIMILGVLSAMSMLVVRSITDRGQNASCATEARNFSSAEESYEALNATYATELQLVAANLLKNESQLYDVVIAGNDSTLVPVGDCIGAGGGGGGGGPVFGTPTPTTWAGVPALSYGTGVPVILLVSVGPGNTQAAMDWAAILAIPEPSTVRVIWVDTTAFAPSSTVPNAIIDALMVPAHNALIWESTPWLTVDGVNPAESADDYVLANSVGPTCINVPAPTLFGSCTITEADL